MNLREVKNNIETEAKESTKSIGFILFFFFPFRDLLLENVWQEYFLGERIPVLIDGGIFFFTLLYFSFLFCSLENYSSFCFC